MLICRTCGVEKSSLDFYARNKVCKECLKKKALQAYYANPKATTYRDQKRRAKNPEKFKEQRRKATQRYRDRHPHAHRKAHRLSRYGITSEAFAKMEQEQNHQCKICGATSAQNADRDWSIDHDHQTGKVRGLLCFKCNILLGMVGDQISILESAIKYLKENSNESI